MTCSGTKLGMYTIFHLSVFYVQNKTQFGGQVDYKKACVIFNVLSQLEYCFLQLGVG